MFIISLACIQHYNSAALYSSCHFCDIPYPPACLKLFPSFFLSLHFYCCCYCYLRFVKHFIVYKILPTCYLILKIISLRKGNIGGNKFLRIPVLARNKSGSNTSSSFCFLISIQQSCQWIRFSRNIPIVFHRKESPWILSMLKVMWKELPLFTFQGYWQDLNAYRGIGHQDNRYPCR